MKLTNIYDTKQGVAVMIYLHSGKTCCIQDISYELKITYSYLSKLFDFLESQGLVRKKSIGRNKEITLTENGKEIAKKLIEINSLVKRK